jgi:chromosome segregation ATPase
MQRELMSNIAVAFDLESVSAAEGSSVAQTPNETSEQPQPLAAADYAERRPAALGAGDAGPKRQLGGNVTELLTKFQAAVEGQIRSHMDLYHRIEALENDEAAKELRLVVRDLHSGLSTLASETAHGIARIEERIASVAESLGALGETVATSNEAFRHLSLSAHEKIADLSELLNSTISRIEQVEKSAAELKECEPRIVASVESLSEKLDLLCDRVAEEQKTTSQLGEDLRIAEGRIAGLPEFEAKISALTGRVSELGSHTAFSMGALSEKVDVLSGELLERQRETSQLGERVRLTECHIAGFSECETRVRGLENLEPELRQIEKTLSELHGKGDQMSADVDMLREGIGSLHGEIGAANVEAGHLKERMERAENGIATSLEQSRSLARLHALLAETYSPR